MRFRLRPLVILVCILLSGIVALRFPSYAHAQEPDEEDPTALRMARQRFQEGVKYFDAGQYSKARAAFLQAYALKKHPSVLLNLAQSELRAGYEAEAANHFAQYLRETDGSNSAQVTKAQAGLDKAKAKVGQLTLAADVEDAYVLVDGKLQGRTPLPGPLYLSPGTHMLGVRLGGKSVTRQVTAVPGESITEMVNLTKAGSPAPNAAAPPAAEEEQQGAPPPADEVEEDARRHVDARPLAVVPDLVGVVPPAVEQHPDRVPVGTALAVDVRHVPVVAGAIRQEADPSRHAEVHPVGAHALAEALGERQSCLSAWRSCSRFSKRPRSSPSRLSINGSS